MVHNADRCGVTKQMRWLMDGGCQEHTHTHKQLRHGSAHTHLIPNKHQKVIMCNLSVALLCSAWLSRNANRCQQHGVIITTQTSTNNRPWQMVIYTVWTRLGNEKKFGLPDTHDLTRNFYAEKVSFRTPCFRRQQPHCCPMNSISTSAGG